MMAFSVKFANSLRLNHHLKLITLLKRNCSTTLFNRVSFFQNNFNHQQNRIELMPRFKSIHKMKVSMSSCVENFREEKDTMGIVRVPNDRLFGAQTQRSKDNFRIGAGQNWHIEQMPKQIIYGFAILKKACARVNRLYGKLDEKLANAIENACDNILADKLTLIDEFPLVIWQTGSGTQSNMNCNEVIANHASELLGWFALIKLNLLF